MYKLAIFDLDGTLLNTLGDLAAAGNHALSLMGFGTHPTEAYRYFVGNGIPNLIHRILPAQHTDEQHARCYELFNVYYSSHKSDTTIPYSGISEVLARLSDNGITCCVNTNKAHDFASELVHSFFGDNVKAVLGQGGGFSLKPAPDAALELCRRYAPDKNAIYIGDSSVDMQTATNAGIDACGVLWGFRDKKELAAFSPKHIVSTPEELYNIITL